MSGSSHPSPLEDCRPVIYVTGFSPFWHHKVNSSKEAVVRLKNLDKKLGAQIHTEIINVSYSDISKIIPQRWRELKPKLVVHVGMSSNEEILKLEQTAYNHEYEYNDDTKCVPDDKVCILGGKMKIESELCMETVSCTINENRQLKLSSKKSTEPGRFVCGYIYYLSLYQDNSRSALIHVPPITDSCSAEDITAAISAAIENLYCQVVNKDNRK